MWAFLFGFSAIMIALFAELEKVSTIESRNRLINWLNSLNYDKETSLFKSTSKGIGDFFEEFRVFKSISISILMFLFTYHIWFEISIEKLWNTVKTAMVALIVFDYFSLNQTLFFLKKLSVNTSTKNVILTLIFDFIITTLLALTCVILFINNYIFLNFLSGIFVLFFTSFESVKFTFIKTIWQKVLIFILIFTTSIIFYKSQLVTYYDYFKSRPFFDFNSIEIGFEYFRLYVVGGIDKSHEFYNSARKVFALFITTYFTSIWIWIYVIILLITRFLIKLRKGSFKLLGIVDYKSKPFVVLGIVATICALTIGVVSELIMLFLN